ncbi:DUF6284 family protein [Streptomyces buecherae]|uniref:DUF6284 family protein n=1 Tax=Streptomyces buecherae TaxID=2763006 RepID=UPI001E62CCEE|nr:DUF6284 family protein [Streptomyces buecherae]
MHTTHSDTLPERGPTPAELDAIEAEMPVILAEVDLLDVQIAMLDRPLYPIDARRVRRAEHRLLVERARLVALVQAKRCQRASHRADSPGGAA